MVSFNYGFKIPFSPQEMNQLKDKLNTSIKKGPPKSTKITATPLAQNHKGSIVYLNTLEKSNPGYTRSLFRYAQKV